MVTDAVKEIDGKYYSFNAEGRLQKGWASHAEGWFFRQAGKSLVLSGIIWMGKMKNIHALWYRMTGRK